jgi:hypothetical protein
MTQHNEGIIITGGTVSGQVVNNATNTTISQVTNTGAPENGTAELLRRLDEFEELLREHQAHVSAYDGARRDIADLKDEVVRPDADEDRIGDAMTRLTKRVGAVTVLAKAAETLTETVRSFF